MKKIIIAIGMAALIVMTSLAGATELKKTEDKQLDQILKIKIGEIKQIFYDNIKEIEPLQIRIMSEERIKNKFNQVYALGITDDTTLGDLFLDKNGNLVIDQDGNLIATDDSQQTNMWRFPLLSLLLKILNANVVCDVDVDMGAGWIFSNELNGLSTRIIIRNAHIRSDFKGADIFPDGFPFRLIKLIIDRMMGKVIDIHQYGNQRITLILGCSVDTDLRSDAKEDFDDPHINVFGATPLGIKLNEILEGIASSLGMQSYSLRARAWFVLGI